MKSGGGQGYARTGLREGPKGQAQGNFPPPHPRHSTTHCRYRCIPFGCPAVPSPAHGLVLYFDLLGRGGLVKTGGGGPTLTLLRSQLPSFTKFAKHPGCYKEQYKKGTFET